MLSSDARAASDVSVTGTMRSKPVVCNSRAKAPLAAGHHDLPVGVANPSDAPDQGPQAGGVHERYRPQVDEQPGFEGQLADPLPKLGHGVGVDLASGAKHGVGFQMFHIDLEQSASPWLV